MEEKLRVCWYCEKWQPGGIQAVQVNLLQHMDLSRIHMEIVVSEDETDLFDEKLRALGVEKKLTLQKHYNNPGKRVLANIFAFGKLLGRERYDVVHLNVCHGVELAYAFWAWFYRVPVRIVHCRNNDIGAGGRSRKLKILCHRLGKVLFNNCANIRLANSDLAAAWLYTKADLAAGRVRILPNGIDAERYAFDREARCRLRQELGIEDKFVLGHVGHFNYQKNHEFLLAVFREVLLRHSGAVLLLAGAGDGEKEARELARRWGIADKVIFYGVTNDVPALMMAMDVFVFPSRFEGFGNVLLEAQAAGLRCFASAHVIPRSVQITENLSWLDLNSPPGVWAEKVLEAGLDYERKSHVQKVVAAGHDISAMAAFLEKLYRRGSKDQIIK